MTISTEPTPLSYDGDDATVDFPVTWKYFSKSHVVATLRSAAGAETVLVLDTGYTLTAADVDVGGTLTATTAPATGQTLVITLEPPNTQSESLPLGGSFPSPSVEDGLDLAAQRDSKIENIVDRCLRVPVTDTQSGSELQLPIDSSRASKFLAFDANGAPIAAAGTSADLGPVSSFIDTLLDDSTASVARATLEAARQPCVTMLRTSDNLVSAPATWIVVKADGSLLDTTGTTSQGLQEAIDEAARYGYDLYVYGGGIKPVKWGVPCGGALGVNPFATVNGSAVVTVTHTAHGMATADRMAFQVPSGDVNGIPAAEFSAEQAITVVDANSYTITLTTPATSTGADGGATSTFQHAGDDVAIITSTDTIDVPPLQGVRWDIHASINFGGAPAGTPPGFDFDSIMASDISFHDQIVVGTSYGSVVQFKPQSELPQDSNGPVITSSHFKFGATVIVGGDNIIFNASSAPIGDGNEFFFNEVNGGSTGIRCINAAGSGFNGNRVIAHDVHGQDVGIDAGDSATGAGNQRENYWWAQLDPNASGVGAEIRGTEEEWHLWISDDTGVPTNGVTLNTTATRNSLLIHRNDATNPVLDAATVKDNLVDGSLPIVETAITTVGNGVLTAAGMVGGVIRRSGPVGAYADTTATATDIIAAIPHVRVNHTFDLTVINTVAFANTVAAGAGVTLAGTTTISASTWRRYIGKITNVATPAVTLTGIGSGTL